MVMWIMSDRAIRVRSASWKASGSTRSGWSTRTGSRPSSSSTGSRSSGCSRWCGTRPSRSTAPTPTFTAATVGRDQSRRFPRVGAGTAAVRRRIRRQVSPSTCSTRPSSSRKRMSRSAGGPAGPRPVRRQFFAETEQVAFCTQNIVPGVDFSNDPLLQGRNFSYLDTQVKRLGGPNFTHIPINAPKCPFATSSRTATWRCTIPGARQLRAELAGREGGPRESPDRIPIAFPAEETGPKGARALRKFRRPLQPGSPVLHEPDEVRTGTTSPTP